MFVSEYSSQYDLAVISTRSTDSIIELWGRCKTGESIFLEIEGLKPYMEVTYLNKEEPSDLALFSISSFTDSSPILKLTC